MGIRIPRTWASGFILLIHYTLKRNDDVLIDYLQYIIFLKMCTIKSEGTEYYCSFFERIQFGTDGRVIIIYIIPNIIYI